MQNDISHYIAQYTTTSEYRVPRYSFPVGSIDASRNEYDRNETDNSQIGFYETAVAGIYNRLHRPKLSSKGNYCSFHSRYNYSFLLLLFFSFYWT